MRVSRHLSPTRPSPPSTLGGFSSTSIFSIPVMILEACSISVIAAQIAAWEALMVTWASTSIVGIPEGSNNDLKPMSHQAADRYSVRSGRCSPKPLLVLSPIIINYCLLHVFGDVVEPNLAAV